jgi:transcription elongation GreA/GreB family factor
MNKAELLRHLQDVLRRKVRAAQQEIASTRASFASDTKSSAGDKHEVGRAMVQQELDKLEEQCAKLITLQQELERVPLERDFAHVAFGSLVETDHGIYFLAIGLGRVEFESATCYAISLLSPIGALLQGKRVGEQVFFNGRNNTVQRIS